MEHVRFESDFKNQPRIGERYIQSTAGAVAVKNSKGDVQVQKVNVKRYIAGKKPDWAPEHSSDEESDEGEEEGEIVSDSEQVRVDEIEEEVRREDVQDHGKRRPHRMEDEDNDNDADDDNDEQDEDEGEIIEHVRPSRNFKQFQTPAEESDNDDDNEEVDEEAIERRRQQVRARAQERKTAESDLLEIEDEEDDEEEEEEESSEYEEDSDSDEEAGIRLKPVFVRKNDRVTIQERERLEEESAVTEEKVKKLAEERKKTATKMVGEIVREELKEEQGVETEEQILITDDENDEEEYEAWKIRELKRIKRDREEQTAREREKEELEKIRNMTEEERREFLRRNPKVITNKSTKGKYKFLQKYYHRGAFFMGEEEEVYKRDFTGATLEDHFNKTVLPKVMQVKNFGRSGRTKYTHLVDQDTTEADSPWFQESTQCLKFHAKIGGGNKQTFEKPSAKKK